MMLLLVVLMIGMTNVVVRLGATHCSVVTAGIRVVRGNNKSNSFPFVAGAPVVSAWLGGFG